MSQTGNQQPPRDVCPSFPGCQSCSNRLTLNTPVPHVVSLFFPCRHRLNLITESSACKPARCSDHCLRVAHGVGIEPTQSVLETNSPALGHVHVCTVFNCKQFNQSSNRYKTKQKININVDYCDIIFLLYFCKL